MTPLYDNLKAFIAWILSLMLATYYLSAKNTVATETLRYIEQATPKIDEKIKELAFLGIDNGKRTNNENKIPTFILP